MLVQNPTSPPNNFFHIYSLIFGTLIIFLSMLLLVSKILEGVCIFALGLPYIIFGIFRALGFKEKVRDWDNANKQRLIAINVLDNQIAEKMAELGRNQTLVKN